MRHARRPANGKGSASHPVLSAFGLGAAQLCKLGTLHKLLKENRSTLTWGKHKLPIATGVARAMAHLHSQSPRIIHRDIKPENILVTNDFTAKLAVCRAGKNPRTRGFA